MPKNTCTIDGCEKPVKHPTRGWCGTHYQRWYRTGDPLATKSAPNGFYGATCTVDGCDNDHAARGFCAGHYARWKRHGDPTSGGPAKTPKGQQLAWVETAASSDKHDCIVWPYPWMSSQKRYGRLRYNGDDIGAHTLTLWLATGEKPEGLYACHLCGDSLCCNPRHLYWGTPAENSGDMVRDGNSFPGESNHQAKLTEDDVRAIRADTRRQVDIAVDYGVSRALIGLVKTRRAWRHVE